MATTINFRPVDYLFHKCYQTLRVKKGSIFGPGTTHNITVNSKLGFAAAGIDLTEIFEVTKPDVEC